jgi:O-antigen/teichoic acid export membrane protein
VISDSTIVKQPSTSGMTTRVMRGGLWTLGGQAVMLLASLAATPFVIRLLGLEAYGVLSLINIVIGYLAFAEMGMGSASTRFGADFHGRNDDDGEVAVIWTSLLIALVPALLAALALAALAGQLVEQALHLPSHLHREAALAIQLAAVGFVARCVSGVINTPQLVRLRMDLHTLIIAGTGVAQILLVPLVLFLGGGLVGAVAVITGSAIVAVLIQAATSASLLPQLLRPRISRSLMRPLTSFGGSLVISSLAAMVLVNAEKILLTRFSSVTGFAYYSVAYTVASMLTIVPLAISQPLLPAFTRLQADKDQEPLIRLYARALRGNLLWIAPAALLLGAAARPFFALWAGPEFGRESTWPFFILVIGLMFNVMAYVPLNLLMAFGRSDIIARIHLAELVPYLLCAAVLTYKFGAVGAALAWSLRVVADMVIFSLAARRISGFSPSPIPANRLSYLAALAALLPSLLLILRTATNSMLTIGATLFCVIIYCGVVWAGVLTPEERLWAQDLFRLRFLNRFARA